MRRRRNRRGFSLIEAVTGAMILIPIALFLLDVTVLIIATTMNDTAVKNAARAAANQPEGVEGFQAAQKSLNSFKSSALVKSLTLSKYDYPASRDAVTCETKMVVALPVPIPGYDNITFLGRAVEPIVGNK